MNAQQKNRFIKTVLLAFLSGTMATGVAETLSPLDISQHPESPEYVPVYTDSLIPLDTSLSWTRRFNGDETFNSNEVLSKASRSVSQAPGIAMGADTKPSIGMDGTGVIKGIRLDQGKVKISHGKIDKYGMPAMTMMFKVEDPSMLQTLKKGQRIGFDVDNSSGGFVVTKLMPMLQKSTASVMQSKGSKMDAQGVVKTIRKSQGKIKVKHGPIEKYGMPGMSMMFKVSNPSSLEGLQKGQSISFNIDNSSGGFVITDIMSTEKNSDVKQPMAISDQSDIKIGPKHQPPGDQGTWFVQLIATRSLEEAESLWQRLSIRRQALRGKSPRYENSKDIIRLLVTPGQSSQDAGQLCQQLKQGGQDCFIRSIK